MKRIFTILVSLILLTPQIGQSQFFKKIKKAAQDKIEKRVEEKIVEEVSEEIANRAMKSVNQAFDQYLKSSYESETGEQWDQSKFDSVMTAAGNSYVSFIEGMNKSANIPDQYTFDVKLDIETQEDSKDKVYSEMMFSTADDVVAIHQTENGKDMIMVMDANNDVLVMFNQKDKTAQAVPSIFSLSKGLSSMHVHLEEEDYKPIFFRQSGKSKKVAGYNAKEYIGETKDDKFSGYFSTELPELHETYGHMIKSLSPIIYEEFYSKVKGMMLTSESIDKGTKKKLKWKVKKVTETTITISKSDYDIPGVEN